MRSTNGRSPRRAPAQRSRTWTDQVLDRLDRAGTAKGQDDFAERGLPILLGEIHEECLDLGGWSILALQAALASGGPPEALEALLSTIATLGAQASDIVDAARLELAPRRLQRQAPRRRHGRRNG